MKDIIATFRDFSSRYALLLFGIIPLILLTSLTVGILNSLWAVIFIPFFWIKNQRTAAILLTHIIFTFGDNRADWADSVRPVRNIAMALLFILTIWDLVQGKYKFNFLFLYWLPFMAWAVFDIGRSPVPLDCGLRTLSYFFLIFICQHAVSYEFKRTNGKFVADWISLMNVVFMIGIILLLIKPDWVILDMEFVEEADDARYQGLYGNPNGLGVATTVFFPMLMLERFYVKTLSKSYSNVSFLIMIASMLFSGSRSALLGTIFFSVFFFIEHRSRIMRNFLKYVAIPAGGTFLYFFGVKIILTIPFLAERLRISENMDFGEATSGRGKVWAFLFSVGRFSKVSEWLWLGKGFYYDAYFFLALSMKYKVPHQFAGAFSGIISLMMNHGIIGMLLFLMTHIFYYRKLSIKGFAFPLFMLMLLSSLFEPWIVSSLNAFTFMFYVVIGVGQTEMPRLASTKTPAT